MAQNQTPYTIAYYMQPTKADLLHIQGNKQWTPGFDVYNLGFVTNAYDMYTGKEKTISPPDWSPSSPGPKIDGAKTYWTFGGSGTAGNASWNPGVPTIDPVTVAGREGESKSTVQNINQWTANGWDGVDFDDELKGKSGFGFNYANIGKVVSDLKQQEREATYTVLGGWNMVSPQGADYGKLNDAWEASSGFDRINLMTYGTEMWSGQDLAWVGKSVDYALNTVGIPANKIQLGVTTDGLETSNLQDWLNAVRGLGGPSPWPEKLVGTKLGGLFVFPSYAKQEPVSPDFMKQITGAIGSYERQENNFSLTKNGSEYSDVIGFDFALGAKPFATDQLTLSGGGGPDLFVLADPKDSDYQYFFNGQAARINDFSLGQGDRIQLTGSQNQYRLNRLSDGSVQIQLIDGGVTVALINPFDGSDSLSSLSLTDSDQFVFIDDVSTVLDWTLQPNPNEGKIKIIDDRKVFNDQTFKNLDEGVISVDNGSLTNNGILDIGIDGVLDESNLLYVGVDGSFYNNNITRIYNKFFNDGSSSNSGTITASDPQLKSYTLVTNDGRFDNFHVFNNYSAMSNDKGATFYNGSKGNSSAEMTIGKQGTPSGGKSPVSASLENMGEFYNYGTIYNNAYVLNDKGATFKNLGTGKIVGNGLHVGALTNHGMISPGNSAGGYIIDGDLTHADQGLKMIELGGSDDGDRDQNCTDHDFIDVTGDLLIDGGRLEVALIDGHQLKRGEEYVISQVDGKLIGQYEGLEEGASLGQFDSIYGEPIDLRVSYKAGDGNDISVYTDPLNDADFFAGLGYW